MSFTGIPLPPADKSPEEYREYVKDAIRPYLKSALTYTDLAILYSGPSKDLWDNSGIADIKSNDALSKDMCNDIAATEGIVACRINDTPAACALNKHDIIDYFKNYYGKNFPAYTSDQVAVLANKAYATVWGGISELFVERDFRHAATAVCGADSSRVFVKDELPTLVKEGKLKTVNGIRFEAVKRVFEEVSPDEAFKLVCLSEINFVYSRASTSKLGVAAVIADAQKRTKYYAYERKETKKVVDKLSSKQKKKLKEIVSSFRLDALYTTSPKKWGREVKKPMRLSLLVAKTATVAAAV